jgi:hypothetical protein
MANPRVTSCLLLAMATVLVQGCTGVDGDLGCSSSDECGRSESCLSGRCTPNASSNDNDSEGDDDTEPGADGPIADTRAPLDCEGTRVDGHEYFVCIGRRPAAESAAACELFDAHLVDLGDTGQPGGDAIEEARVRTLAALRDVSDPWLGLTDIVTEGAFVWAGGVPLDVSRSGFSPGEPNNTDEDCVEEGAAGWNDRRCFDFLQAVCEVGPGALPADCVDLTTFGGTAYKLCTSPRSWFDGDALCKAGGGALVSYGDQPNATEAAAERAAVDAAVRARTSESYWIGLNDFAREGSLVWSKDQTALGTFRPFALGEPNNIGGEDCAILRPEGWNDVACNEPHPSVCERD